MLKPGSQNKELRVLAIGAHPDDPDYIAGGTLAQLAAAGCAVKLVSLSSGDGGHPCQGGGALALRRRAEAAEAGRRLGVAGYETLDFHDGELMPNLELRHAVVRLIRQWRADIVLTHRPNDYHPDHRYTGIVVQDAAYLVMVPNVCPDTPALEWNPLFLYYQDRFLRPAPFRADFAIDIGAYARQRIEALDAHVSQFHEWLPWIDRIAEPLPADPEERKNYIARYWPPLPINPEVRASLVKWYGPERGNSIEVAEAFEVCEYGYQPSGDELRHFFPMLGSK